MARILPNFQNIQAPDDDYPFGRIKDDTGSEDGTPVNEFTNGDIHQFFAKLMDAAGITANGLPDNDYSGFQLFQALIKAINLNNSAGVIETGSNVGIKTKAIPIGDWNMDSTETLTIAHGLDITKVISATVFIIPDTGTASFPLNRVTLSTGTCEGGFFVGTTTVFMFRIDSTDFDSNLFDSTSFNRGWITIWYEE